MAQIFDIDGQTINPATEEGQALIIAALSDSDLNFETMEDDLAAIKAAVELIDHLTAANSGNADENTQRVVNATDDPNLSQINALLNNTAQVGVGQKLTCTTADTCPAPLTVVALATYLITAQDGIIHLGISDCDSDDTLILWTVPAGVTMPITIPEGTSLYYFSDTDGVIGRLSRIN